jgi:hypothetical protein
MLHLADEFILFDDVQYTRRDWRNRNIIKSPSGLLWLTIPVEVKGRYSQAIKDTIVSDRQWNKSHWKTIVHCYSKAPCFEQNKETLEELYLGTNETHLSLINYRFLTAINRLLGITTPITWSMDYKLKGDRTERLLGLCEQAGATEYLSGPTAKAYLDEEQFMRRGITVKYMDYSAYPEYRQLYSAFEPKVSILDLILNEGPRAFKFMKSFD